MVRPWINLLAGAWAFISSFLIYASQPLNFLLIGVVITIFGFWTYHREWQGYVNGIIGLWLILSAFFPSLSVSSNLMISGIVVMAIAIWRIYSLRTHRPIAG